MKERSKPPDDFRLLLHIILPLRVEQESDEPAVGQSSGGPEAGSVFG